ncbi:helix-turn-helix domain-containing protein [Carboxylicivirga linearis]|uniref:Helix-turn-helix domain-containing protein n=1 Tax=Carboxylicivirga linearis TaxID=1628157 RepID=A0ABS5JVT0_9BACT|nr:helix-turn-helix domain-containing protein [Carboxylicivirga linearis]MBS2099006.1 helix-turn-helix domain-containing protein [Carboxylicivirga linearis]
MNTPTKIKELRERNGLSQEELCENSGISLRTIQRIENGESVPRGSTLKMIASTLNVSSDSLINTLDEETTLESDSVKTKINKIRFPWYIFGYTVIGASSAFLIGIILTLLNILPKTEYGGLIVISASILCGAIGMIIGKGVESKNK